MQRLLYEPNEAQRVQIAWVIGQVCSRVASLQPGQVSELLHRLVRPVLILQPVLE